MGRQRGRYMASAHQRVLTTPMRTRSARCVSLGTAPPLQPFERDTRDYGPLASDRLPQDVCSTTIHRRSRSPGRREHGRKSTLPRPELEKTPWPVDSRPCQPSRRDRSMTAASASLKWTCRSGHPARGRHRPDAPVPNRQCPVSGTPEQVRVRHRERAADLRAGLDQCAEVRVDHGRMPVSSRTWRARWFAAPADTSQVAVHREVR